MLAALACGGHVLLRGRARHGEDGARARDRRQRRGRRRRAHPVHARPPADRRHRASPSSTSETRDFEFRPGPVFANVVLVDEINRAMPKTQSALLEAMAERQVTVDGVTRALPDAVPRARDREPDRAGGHVPAARGAARPLLPARRRSATRTRSEELRIVARAAARPSARATSSPCVDARRGARAAATRSRTSTSTQLARALDRRARARDARRSTASRSAPPSAAASRSSGPRARGRCLHGRDYVTPEDVEQLFLPVLGHRLVLTPSVPRRDARARPRRGARRRSASAASSSRRGPSPTGTRHAPRRRAVDGVERD